MPACPGPPEWWNRSFEGSPNVEWNKQKWLYDLWQSTCNAPSFVTPESLAVNQGGTPVGSVTDMQTPFDGNEYNLPENNTNPGFDLDINFVNVPKITGISLEGRYVGSASHSVGIYLYNYVTSARDFIFELQTKPASTTGLNEFRTIRFPNLGQYVDGSGNAQMSIVHSAVTGNVNHDLYVGYAALLY